MFVLFVMVVSFSLYVLLSVIALFLLVVFFLVVGAVMVGALAVPSGVFLFGGGGRCIFFVLFFLW